MISDIESLLSRFQSSWTVRENGSTITFSQSDLDSQACDKLLQQVRDLRDLLTGRNLILTISDSNNVFEYVLSWEPNGDISISQDSDQGTDADMILSSEDAITSLELIRNHRTSRIESLDDFLSGFLEDELVELSFKYRIDTDHLSGVIQSELSSVGGVHFYLEKSTYLSHFVDNDLPELRDAYISEEPKELFLIQNLDGPCYNGDIGFFTLSGLETTQFDDFSQLRASGHELISSVGRECIIDEFESVYIPPTVFEFDSINDSEFVSKMSQMLSGPRLLYGLFSISNVVMRKGEKWEIRIHGKKVFEQQVQIQSSDDGWHLVSENPAGEEYEIPCDESTVSSFVDVFEWVYEVRATDRISVLRNIITLYTTNLLGLVENIDDILESTRSNFKFYAEESVDEFINLQQDVSNYLLETQREFGELRRNLANNLNRDLFRVFGFVIVTWAGIFLQIERVITVRNALTASLIPVILYLGLSLRAVHGLDQQFESLENSRKKYYKMYRRQMNDELFAEIAGSGDDNQVTNQFETDKKIYYGIFGAMLLASIYLIIDIQMQFVVSDLIQSIVTELNSG